MTTNWVMLKCDERVNQIEVPGGLGKTQGQVCGEKFGRMARLVEHKRTVHGKGLATDDQVIDALGMAKQLAEEILSSEDLVLYMDFVHYRRCAEEGTHPNDVGPSAFTARLRCFLTEPAVRGLQ